LVRHLSPEDLSILALENETQAGHTCKVVILGNRIGPDVLRASMPSAWRAPELGYVRAHIDSVLCWVSDGLVDLDMLSVWAACDAGGDLHTPGWMASVATRSPDRRQHVIPTRAPTWSWIVLVGTDRTPAPACHDEHRIEQRPLPPMDAK